MTMAMTDGALRALNRSLTREIPPARKPRRSHAESCERQRSEKQRRYLDLEKPLRAVVDVVCAIHLVPREGIIGHGHGRDMRAVAARHLAIYLCRELTGASFPILGQFFDGRNHTTMISACHVIEKRMAEQHEFQRKVERLIRDMRGEVAA